MLGSQGLEELRFEKKFPIFRKELRVKSDANLDVFIKRASELIAIESKLVEYFSPKKAEFKPAYSPDNLEHAESCWLDEMNRARNADPCNLDVAQLVKHYFGLRRYQVENSIQFPITLLYIYWEPTNADENPICKKHRDEVKELQGRVKASAIKFKLMSYRELWEEWSKYDSLKKLVDNLKARYEVSLQ